MSERRDEVRASVGRGIPLLTAYLERDVSGKMDESSLRAVLGYNVSDDEVIQALSDMLHVAELVMLYYSTKTDELPIELLREIAAKFAADEQ
ncbi:hypothetical protein SEA_DUMPSTERDUDE_35 [Gordonia phage DumpsterDude]|uniref:Uncharacterized protein n=1 Tax=Gordonia phage DumpsterDude TaxID=2713262 RepID=A0A6G8R0B3_9CAUD|nr:hypothetical protein JZX77_gp35 [Gordonia phage DumpsterDude]QIN93623.1 hypothetical protein SEA_DUMPSTERDUDE_35 [Gordonia phage DumpsterDude]